MPKHDTKFMNRLNTLLDQYADAVEGTDLSPASKAHYIDFASCFVRWIDGEFEPGRVSGKRPPPNWNKRTDKTPRIPAPEPNV